MRPGEPEVHAGGQSGVKVEVVVLSNGGGGFVDLREHGRHPLGRRRGRGQEAHFAASLLKSPVDRGQQHLVVAQTHGQRPREG